ncbi:MAG: ATP-binding protein [Eggerthellaceae bacterium]|nr:ATP-binding protein [Eggerthellaceae bacterium]
MSERSLQEFVHEVSGESHLRVEHDFGDGFVRLRTSEAERRQAAQDIQCSENIVLELLRNSRDAHASHVFLAVSREGSIRRITVIDDGDGIPKSMHEHVFEPRVTSKLDTSHMDAWGLHGRGMALFSIAENAQKAYVVDSETGLGCAIRVETDVTKLGEKADQSAFPRFELTDTGSVNVRGPRNILRTACEFAIEARDSCSVFVGTAAEIAATVYSFGNSTLSSIDKAFCHDAAQLPLVKRLATAADPNDFASIAAGMGLELSPRTAHRIFSGQIIEAESLIERIEISTPAKGKASGKSPRSRKAASKVRLQREDVHAMSQAVRAAYSDIAERYYLDGDVDPGVRVSGGSIIVTIPLVEKE